MRFATAATPPSAVRPEQLGPRLAFAYSLNDKTVFRGAYALDVAPQWCRPPARRKLGTEIPQRSGMIVSNDNTTFGHLSNPFPNGFNFPLGASKSL